MTKKARKTTSRLSATITNPKPQGADNEVRSTDSGVSRARPPRLSELAVLDLLNELPDAGRRGSEAMGELQRRYGGYVEGMLRMGKVYDWQDRESLSQDVWLKLQTIVRRPASERGGWDPLRVAQAADPLKPLLGVIADSQAKDYHKTRASRRRRFEAFAEASRQWGDDVGDYGFTSAVAQRRLAAKEIISKDKKAKEPKALEGRLTRRLAASAQGRLPSLIAALPETLRDPLLLRVEGRTCVEIAGSIGTAPGEASKRVTDARVALVEMLDGSAERRPAKKRRGRRRSSTGVA